MGWEIVLFNLSRKVNKVEEIDDSVLQEFPDWDQLRSIFSDFFPDIIWKGVLGEINRGNFTISLSAGDPEEQPPNIFIQLYGEFSIYEIVRLCSIQGWQIYDISLGEMIDIANPENNGYSNFQSYLAQIKHFS